MSRIARTVRVLAHAEDGATMVEYGLMLALVVVVCATAAALMGSNANNKFNASATVLS